MLGNLLSSIFNKLVTYNPEIPGIEKLYKTGIKGVFLGKVSISLSRIDKLITSVLVCLYTLMSSIKISFLSKSNEPLLKSNN